MRRPATRSAATACCGEQSAVGTGTGVLGDRKKLSTRQQSGTFFADDTLRPPSLVTFDMKSNIDRTLGVLFFGDTRRRSPTSPPIPTTPGPTARSVDAHAYVGFTYDYFFAALRPARPRQQQPPDPDHGPPDSAEPGWTPAAGVRRLLRQRVLVCRSAGANQGFIVFGEGIPSNLRYVGSASGRLAGSFDIVAHELSHAVTSYSSDLDYLNESGALNEAFSDIMAVGAEFYLVSTGRSDRAGRLPDGRGHLHGRRHAAFARCRIRPRSATPITTRGRYVGPEDNGGVHINSGISNHAFYLAIEGGTNRTSGLPVQGVGASQPRADRARVLSRVHHVPDALVELRAGAAGDAARGVGALRRFERGVPRRQQAWTAVGVN